MARRLKKPGLLTQTAYAKLRGVSQQYISARVRDGVIPVQAGGLIDPVSADVALTAIADPLKAARKFAEDGEISANADGRSMKELSMDLLRARLAHETELGKKYRHKRIQLEAQLIGVGEVREAHRRRHRQEREALLAWPATIARKMASELGVHMVALQRQLEKAVRDHLSHRPGPDSILADVLKIRSAKTAEDGGGEDESPDE